MHSPTVWLHLLCFVVWATGLQSAWAAPGDQDAGFGDDGWVITDLGGEETGHGIAVQPSGRIILAGTKDFVGEDFALVGYFENGTLDDSFGELGTVVVDFNGQDDSARDVIALPDGSIVAAGSAYTGTSLDFALVRLDPSGILDLSFGSEGLVTSDFSGTDDQGWALALQSDGKILLTGSTFNGTNTDIALARYSADGTLDTTFGSGGLVVLDFNGRDQEARALTLQPDDKILAAGFTFVGLSTDFILARFNPDGSPDTSFGNNGVVVTDFQGNNDRIWDLLLQDDGKIVAAGSAFTTLARDFALSRYDQNGSLDISFGDQGLVTTDFDGFVDEARVVLGQGTTITALGSAFMGLTHDFALARYDSNGVLDQSFGLGGRVTTDFNGTDNRLFDALPGRNSTILAAGETSGLSLDFAMTRFLTTESPPSNGTNATIQTSGGGCVTSSKAGTSTGWAVLFLLLIVWQKHRRV